MTPKGARSGDCLAAALGFDLTKNYLFRYDLCSYCTSSLSFAAQTRTSTVGLRGQNTLHTGTRLAKYLTCKAGSVHTLNEHM